MKKPSAETVSMPRPASSPTALIPSGKRRLVATKSPEHDVIRVQSDSVLAIDKVSATDTGADRVTETELDLRTGSIFFSVKKQAAASRFEIKLANGIAGIRGTYAVLRIVTAGLSAVRVRWLPPPPIQRAR